MKAAIIGLGRMGMRHAIVLRQCEHSIVAVSDMDPTARDAAGSEFAIPDTSRFASGEELLVKARPELLVIATTAPSHHDLVIKAVQNGVRMILCEKPMATNLRDCEAMVAACRAAGVRLAVNHQMRFMEQYTVPKDLISSEEFGGLGSINVNAGNFGVAMNGTHYFEMFRYMTDEEPMVVSAWFSRQEIANPRGPQFKDAAGCVRMETASGKRFYMDCSADQGHGMQVVYNCRHGRITVDELAGTLTYVVREEAHRLQPTTRYGMSYSSGSKNITLADAVGPTRSVMEALIQGHNFPTGEQGALAMKLLIAAHLSNEQAGATIDVHNWCTQLDRTLPIA